MPTIRSDQFPPNDAPEGYRNFDALLRIFATGSRLPVRVSPRRAAKIAKQALQNGRPFRIETGEFGATLIFPWIAYTTVED